MFVVTALHTKRQPHVGTDKAGSTIRKQGVERRSLPPAVSHRHQLLHSPKVSASSRQAVPCISEPGMTRTDGDRDAYNRNDRSRRIPVNVPRGQVAPPRIRRFIPKPLVLVERMKARQFLESSPAALGSSTRPTTAMSSPLSVQVTPPTRGVPMCTTLSSESRSSSSVSISSQNGVVSGSVFGMMPRPVRPLSGITLRDSSSSTDTFVADSPCHIKQATPKVPILVTEADPNNVHLGFDSFPRKEDGSGTGILIPDDIVAMGVVHHTWQSNNPFEPAMTSTPFASSQATTNGALPPMAFNESTVYQNNSAELMPVLSDTYNVTSPTSRAVYRFRAPQDTYIVKLPNSGSVISGSASEPLANARNPALDSRRLSNHTASPSPMLVLDGVFVLPKPPPPSHRTFHGFPRPRKPPSRRPLVDISNTAIPSPSRPPTTVDTSLPLRGTPGLESPRSKLARVLTAHSRPQMTSHVRKQARVPPLVKGVPASNDPRTQCEIEGLRVRRVVGLGRGANGGIIGDDAGEKGAIDRMSLAGVGMVAKLRARWEMGTKVRCGVSDDRA